MSPKPLDAQAVLVALMLLSQPAGAVDAEKRIENMQQESGEIYGAQLMTAQERRRYHAKLRELKTQEERDAFRLTHHQCIQARIMERNLILQDPTAHREASMQACGQALNARTPDYGK